MKELILTPKISVLMPAYNVSKYIAESIESILSQTLGDFELIITDDCSTDETWQIIKSYAGTDSRIIALQNERNLGISGNRNKLISLARAKYIVWQDADDISLPYRLAHQFEYMENHSEVGISGGYLEFFNDQGHLGIRRYAPDDATLRGKIFRYSPVAQPAAIIRKECFIRTGLFSGASPAADDLAMSFQIGTQYKFGNIQEVLIRYRESSTNTTFTKLRIIEMYTLFLRTKYSNNPAYQMHLGDKIYFGIQYLMVFLIPPAFKIKIFNKLRNSKK